MIQIIDGDLATCKADVIVQQSNCLTTKPLGLAAYLAEFLGVDPYKSRTSIGKTNLAIEEHRDTPGKIRVYHIPPKTGVFAKHMVCFFAQFTPGPAGKYYKNVLKESSICNEETGETRREWFQMGLDKLGGLMETIGANTVAFPYGIGCGLAGGSWTHYLKMIQDWASANPQFKVLIVRKT